MSTHEGMHLFYGWQVILKGLLESDREVSLVTGPHDELLDPLWRAANDEGLASILRAHGLSLAATPSAQRALQLAGRAARSGHGAMAIVTNDQLDQTLRTLHELTTRPLPLASSLVVLLEDDPARNGAISPRGVARQANLACIEPYDLKDLRQQIDAALRLSRATCRPVGLTVHRSLLQSAQTVESFPNREQSPIDAMLVRGRRPRISETRDLLRMARRLELNTSRTLPSPGERVPIGCITVGPAAGAINHLTHDLQLIGRVPILLLRLTHPLDEAAISRFLSRCRRVIVLEPRPGEIEEAIHVIASSAMERGERVASIWGRAIPDESSSEVRGTMPREGALHPSVLARELLHLLHMIRPTIDVAGRLAPVPPELPAAPIPRGEQFGDHAALNEFRHLATDLDQWLRDHAPYDEREVEPTSLAIDGIVPNLHQPRLVFIEFWTGRDLGQTGLAAIRHAARTEAPWIFLVADFETPDRVDLERLIRGVVPGEYADRVRIQTGRLAERTSLREALQEAALTDRLSILLIKDGQPPRYDPVALERELAEIDRFGFQPNQLLTWPVEQACLFNFGPDDPHGEPDELPRGRNLMRTELRVEPAGRRTSGRIRFRVQPLLEQIEVVRTRPPAWVWRTPDSPRPEVPTPIHRSQSHWRVHIAGLRGLVPGLVAQIIADAGREMGYEVGVVADPSVIGPGRRAWAQLLFSHPPKSERVERHRTSTIPFGEADLLLVLDGMEGLRAIDPNQTLRVASTERTTIVANTGGFSGESEPELTENVRERLAASFKAVSQDSRRAIDDFAAGCRLWFHTDRLTDLVLLGVAYQRGFIPVTLEAIERAVARVEERGYGRAQEAFSFGRQLGFADRLLTRPRVDPEWDLDHLTRRLVLSMKHSRWRGVSIAAGFESLLERCRRAMPGLSETNSGRAALRTLITAAYRCLEWGGLDYAQSYVDLMTALYRQDRADSGRALTRYAVLPLAEAMLIHEPIYLATMATSPEQRRRVRERINVKPGRGDRMERRYLTRVELIAFRRQFRADIRTSDWPARIARALWHICPNNWRGSARERELRTYLMELVRRAGYESENRYDHWRDLFHRLHLHAAEGRLRGMAMSELRMLADHEKTFHVATAAPTDGTRAGRKDGPGRSANDDGAAPSPAPKKSEGRERRSLRSFTRGRTPRP